MSIIHFCLSQVLNKLQLAGQKYAIRRFIIKQKGVTILELLISAVIVGVALLGISSLLFQTKSTQVAIESYSWLNQTRSEAIKLLKNHDSFRQIATHAINSDLACIKEKLQNPAKPLRCPSQGGQISEILDFQGRKVAALAKDEGLDLKGRPCQNYSTNPDCIFRYEMSWRPRCKDDKCLTPDIVISGQLKVKNLPNLNLKINPEFYNFTVIQKVYETKEALCETSQLGQLQGDGCKIMPKMVKCTNPGEYLVGFNRDGTARCAPRNLPRCSSGFIFGVDGNSNPLCDPRTCI
jgi:type II secretory pathway pseudopilin PulG